MERSEVKNLLKKRLSLAAIGIVGVLTVGRLFILDGAFASSTSAKTAEISANHDAATSSPSASELVVLLVDKTALKAKLMSWPELNQAPIEIKTFTVAIGKEKGDKQRKGDNKTPEGIYLTEAILDGQNLPDKYGPFAITLNYPNPVDLLDGKTGYGIWLHGVIADERVEEANVTEGCVAFYNADISQLTKWLRPSQGVVVIAEQLTSVNRPEDLLAVQNLTNEWYQSWAQRKIDDYIGHYAAAFLFNGMDRERYADYKRNVFRSYRTMDVKIDKLRVISHPKYAVSLMEQEFHGDDRFHSRGRKILYWQRKNENERFQIAREVHENKQFEFVKFTVEKTKDGQQAAILRDEGHQSSKL